jgi:hypothetical protein
MLPRVIDYGVSRLTIESSERIPIELTAGETWELTPDLDGSLGVLLAIIRSISSRNEASFLREDGVSDEGRIGPWRTVAGQASSAGQARFPASPRAARRLRPLSK